MVRAINMTNAVPDEYGPVRDQGAAAFALGLARTVCPYSADGPVRDVWLSAFDAAAEAKAQAETA